MIRTLFFLGIFVPATIVMGLAAFILGRGLAHAVQLAWSRLTLAAAGIRVDADLSALTPGKIYVFFVNHQSFMDIPVVLSQMKHWPLCMVARDNLFSIPLFGQVMRYYGYVPIKRESATAGMRSIQQAADLAKSGTSVLIFPEGTRAFDLDTLQEFQVGASILAIKAGLPVAPLVINGTGKRLPRGSNIIRPGRVKLTALPPVDVSGLSLKDRQDFTNRMHTLMNAAYTANQEQDRGH